jgi:hypothetical protein
VDGAARNFSRFPAPTLGIESVTAAGPARDSEAGAGAGATVVVADIDGAH